MSWYLTLELTDRDGNRRQTGLRFPSFVSVSQIVDAVNEYASVVEGISDARVTGAKAVYRQSFPQVNPPQTSGTVYQRLYILFTSGNDVAAISIPAPIDGIYDAEGPLRNIRVSQGANAFASALPQLRSVLASAVRPDGRRFPAEGEVVAGRDT